MTNSKHRRILPVLAVSLLVALAGCGKKPNGLLPPEDAAADAYPQVYPRPLPGEAAAAMPDADLAAKYKARPEQSLQ